jgi:hypothetical protein
MTARDLCRQAVIAEGRRTLTLTGRGLAALDAARRVTPADLFTDKQLRAIEAAGLSVFFVRADVLLDGAK